MRLSDICSDIPAKFSEILSRVGIDELRPAQEKAINAGLLKERNVLICTPTASGKTLIAELAMLKAILDGRGKGVYVVPLKALASEKAKEFKRRYADVAKIALSVGDSDSQDVHLGDANLIVCTSEKLDSLIRHRASWLKDIATLVIDEVHLLNDRGRGPTLEVVITLLRKIHPQLHIVALSATIGNPLELANWLGAELVLDEWRPVPLRKGVYVEGRLEFA
ncbi:DEAD/DEAH box helicase [Candidatus Woesearchaeota archaeon]|nr:DEAD/DEAH box helicase [Candidatus Woesearchaeota archaeon]